MTTNYGEYEDMDEMRLIIGKNVARWRKFNGMTQDDLGYKIGLKHGQVGRYERGQDRLPAYRLWRIAQVLSVPIQEMFE